MGWLSGSASNQAARDAKWENKMAKESERDIRANHKAFTKEAMKADRRAARGK